jgi:hypothetical protein
MFVLKVEARTTKADALRKHVLTWPTEVGKRATGWLGNTAGVSPEGDFILLMRFVSEEAAWITMDLPENTRWWQVCGRHLDTKPVFTGSTDVTAILSGGSDDAAAVRITRGRADTNRFRDSLSQLETLAAKERTDVIGGIVAWHDEERFTEVLYLKSKDFATSRQVAAAAAPLRRLIDDHQAAMTDPAVLDLTEPWLMSPSDDTSVMQKKGEAK